MKLAVSASKKNEEVQSFPSIVDIEVEEILWRYH